MGKNKKGGRPIDPMSNPRTMSREGMRLIRNMANGTFNFYNEGHVFRDTDFCNAVIFEVDKRRMDASIHLVAMQYTYGASTDAHVLNLIHRDRKTLEAYNLIREILNSIVINGGDTTFLHVLENRLPQYKYFI